MMTHFKELHLDTTLSLAVIATGLMVSWFGSVESAGQQAARVAAEDRVTISQDDGHYRMTVTAQRPHDFVPATHQATAQLPTPART